MQRLSILNGKEIKKLKESLLQQFGHAPEEDYAYLRSEKDKIYLINKAIAKIDLRKLIVDKVGLYFAEAKNGSVRLSKEGSYLLAREARKKKRKLKNVVILNKEEVQRYFQGNDLERDVGEESKLVLLQYQNDILGCARYKEKKILNFLPKIHRGEVIV